MSRDTFKSKYVCASDPVKNPKGSEAFVFGRNGKDFDDGKTWVAFDIQDFDSDKIICIDLAPDDARDLANILWEAANDAELEKKDDE